MPFATAAAGSASAAESAAPVAPVILVPGLRWANDAAPGFTRRRDGSGFVYLDTAGRPLRDEAALQRIRKLAIPPAYEDVWICPRPDGHLQATGRDARGRKQYRYHLDWAAGRGQTKFERLAEFAEVLPLIRRRVQAALSGSDEPTRERVLATLVRLLDTTYLRIGNRAYAEANGSFGLSTLRNRHAGVLKTGEVKLSFIGKSGVRHDVNLRDPRIARLVRRCRDLPGQELFQYLGEDGLPHRLDSTDVNDWLAEVAGRRVTAKDFRTWHGSVQALELTLAGCSTGDCADAPACSARSVLVEVARRLGNTPAVCRKAYIHPTVLGLSDALADAATRAEVMSRRWVAASPAARGLSVGERRLVGLLAEGQRRRRSGRTGRECAPAAPNGAASGAGAGAGARAGARASPTSR